jgi:hypothetical protein
MGRYPQPSNEHGSLRDTQALVNMFPKLLFREISQAISIKSKEINWVSPRQDDEFAEYRDEAFIRKIGIETLRYPLNDFWPQKGPQWDALGVGEHGEVFLVEAKANMPEIVSPGTLSRGKSRDLIEKSLNETKLYLNIGKGIDWTGNFYQYTNRIAHLYFLRVLNKIPAYLIFIYFLGDTSVSGPSTVKEWQAAITVVHKCLGLKRHKLSKYNAAVFIDLKDTQLPYESVDKI